MWFAVHVKPGTEAQAVELLKSTSKSNGLQEVFCPMAECQHTEYGDVQEAREPMMEGLVFVVAPSKWELRACMRRAQELQGLYSRCPNFDALEDGEEVLIDVLAKPGERTVEQSEGMVSEDGFMKITGGPLLGREDEIRKYSSGRRWAYLDARIAGKPVRAKAGVRLTRSGSLRPQEA